MSVCRLSKHGPGYAAIGALFAVMTWPVTAQSELYKCTDGSATTYSSTACEKLGLKSAGAIRDRLTVIGSDRPAAKQEAIKAQTPVAEDEEQRARKAAAAIKPMNPLIDKLVK